MTHTERMTQIRGQLEKWRATADVISVETSREIMIYVSDVRYLLSLIEKYEALSRAVRASGSEDSEVCMAFVALPEGS